MMNNGYPFLQWELEELEEPEEEQEATQMAGVYFGGKQIYKPGAYTVADTSQMYPTTPGGSRIIAIIGIVPDESEADAKTLYSFNDPRAAQAVLGDSDLLNGARVAWSPSTMDAGADVLICVPLKESEAEASDWQEAIDALYLAPIAGIVLLTADPAIHAMGYAAVQQASNNRRERRLFVGGDLGLDKQDTLDLATSLGHRAIVATPGMERSIDGEMTMLPPYFTACAVAGLWSGLEVNEPLTFKYLNTSRLEKQWDDTEIDEFLQGGVLPVENVYGRGRRIVQQRTAHTADNNTALSELSTGATIDFMVQDLRTSMEDRFVGRPGTTAVQTAMRNAAFSKLRSYERAGYITGDAGLGVPAFRNLTLRREGRAYFIEFEASVTEPVNWILITAYFKPPQA